MGARGLRWPTPTPLCTCRSASGRGAAGSKAGPGCLEVGTPTQPGRCTQATPCPRGGRESVAQTPPALPSGCRCHCTWRRQRGRMCRSPRVAACRRECERCCWRWQEYHTSQKKWRWPGGEAAKSLTRGSFERILGDEAATALQSISAYSQYPLMYHPCALLCQRLHTLCDRYVLYSTCFQPMSCLQGLSGPHAAFSCTLVRGYLPVIYYPDI